MRFLLAVVALAAAMASVSSARVVTCNKVGHDAAVRQTRDCLEPLLKGTRGDNLMRSLVIKRHYISIRYHV